MKKTTILLLMMLLTVSAFAQRRKRERQERSPRQELVYDNHQYLPTIKTVRLFPDELENALPVIDLHGTDQLHLSFDDLRADVRNFFFSIEHCTADWKPSRLNQLEYAHSFNEDRILDFTSSINTLQPYTHYRVSFPSEHVRPKLAGNYLLKVYEDADRSRLILTRKFYVVTPVIPATMQLLPSTDVTRRQQNQKINLTLSTGSITINNPYQDVKIRVMQNQRPDRDEWLGAPQFISDNNLIYNNTKTLDFGGANEFNYVDLRSTRLASERVTHIAIDSSARIMLMPDEDLSTLSYGSVFDEDGAFFIRNQDKSDADAESEYMHVRFSLKDTQARDGDVYIVGGFNQYQYSEENKMTYDAENQMWTTTLLLKQGLYDYQYSYVDLDGTIHTTTFSGNHFQTGNTYQALVYIRRPGTTWDELLGYSQLFTKD